MLQLSFRKATASQRAPKPDCSLQHLRCGERGVLERLDLPEDEAQRLMEMGFLPGCLITASHCAPGGDPRVFQVDGSEIALRGETAARLRIRLQKV